MTQTTTQHFVDNYDDFAERTPVATPVEIRLGRPRPPERFVFTLWRDDHGIIRHSLDNGRGGSSQSVSNLQLKVILPKKAIPGWQAEAKVEAVCAVRPIEEVKCFSTNEERRRRFAEKLNQRVSARVRAVDNAEETVRHP